MARRREFVHPVIMGKRALPAVAIHAGKRDHDAAGACAVRATSSSRSPRRRPCHRDAMQRAPSWGALDVWVGCGPSPWRGSPIIRVGRTRRRSPATTARSCSPTTCCGSSPTCASSTPGSSASPTSHASPTAPASPAPTKAAWPRSRAVGAGHCDGAHRGRHRRDRHQLVVPARPATSSSSTPAPPSRSWIGARSSVRGPTSSTPSSRRRARRAMRCSPISPLGRSEGDESRDPPDDDTRSASRGHRRGRRRDGRTVRRAVGSCSRSATAAARPTPRRSPLCSRAHRTARPLPAPLPRRRPGRAHRARQRRRLRPRVLTPADRPRRPGDIALGLSTSGSSRNLLVAFAEARRRGLLTVGLAGYDGGAMAASDDIDHCLVVALRQRPPHPGDASGARCRAVGSRCRSGLR